MFNDSIQSAWKLVARGLHIHRYFLHVDPMLNRQLARKLQSASHLVESHGFNPGHPDGWQSAVLEALSIAELSPAAAQMSRWNEHARRGLVVIRGDARELQLSPAEDFSVVAQARALLQQSDTDWIVRIIAGVLECRECLTPSAVLRPRVIEVDLNKSVPALAEDLLKKCSIQLLQLFALARAESPSAGTGDFTEQLGRLQPVLTPLYEPFYRSIVDEPQVRATFEQSALSTLMQTAIATVDYLPFSDLVETTLPTARQFVKFVDGLAPGQAA